MEEYQTRVIDEETDLSNEIRALAAFIDGDAFKAVDREHRLLLEKQQIAMLLLRNVLRDRIAIFKRDGV